MAASNTTTSSPPRAAITAYLISPTSSIERAQLKLLTTTLRGLAYGQAARHGGELGIKDEFRANKSFDVFIDDSGRYGNADLRMRVVRLLEKHDGWVLDAMRGLRGVQKVERYMG